MRRIAVSCLLGALMLFPGCNNSDNKTQEAKDGYGEYEIADPSSSGKIRTHVVEIREMKFIPAVVEVSKGDTVIWVNHDIVAHDVTAQSGAWASSRLEKDNSWKRAITGSEAYYCNLHVVMTGKIIVDGRDIAMAETGITICGLEEVD